MTTLELLQERWKANSLPLTTVREQYFAHIKTDKRLRALIRAQEVKLPTFKHSNSRLAPLYVRLSDLAEYLDTCAAAAA
ncbi:MAG: pyocin activator PrtN family protein [Gammaproteobacteria bacterium]|uniref:Putative pyocin activator protein n=1 Tax=viral metagenome TaxID=1070528 RepID=A0A6M3J8A4_9ZZZZ|nr:pyocin activator PrtN family protein [Gammaproteobacteria bacterium]MBU1492249.1 pyocin activator PrtN family protein [Gammaproteobacteria bacterium]MBU2066820.1 pyocin activator PrtN family protein [Gammaproteobacteria bacterium]MBU2137364.1 pyocin activator PrtN family protein [Gammaproteobacteria bacterium]MBU2215075.1 pyocin activator PrtN family protein [Gammaproteobacteria bacterium]